MLYLAAGNISFEGTWGALKAAQWWVLGPYLLAMAGQHFFRSLRWHFLLAPIHKVPLKKIFVVASVGFFAILALPLRMGEFVRPILIAEPPHLRISQGLGTMAVERIFDGIFLSVTAFIVITSAQRRMEVPEWISATGWIALILFLTALVVLVMALWQRDRAVSLCHAIFKIVSLKLADKAASLAHGIVDGFKVLPDFKRVFLFSLCTAGYWLLNIVALWFLAKGFYLDLTFSGALGVMSLLGIGIMVPAGPGFIGNYELFAEGALRIYVQPAVLAKWGPAYIITSHAVNALWYILLGLLAMMSPLVSFRGLWRASTEDQQDDTANTVNIVNGHAPAATTKETRGTR